jgi:hypothetical protein
VIAQIAAAMQPTQRGDHADDGASQRTNPQPEGEPDETEAINDVEALAVEKKAEKVDLRNVKVSPFDGSVPAGSFDAKAREFRDELDENMESAQALAGQAWSDEVKKAVMKMFS